MNTDNNRRSFLKRFFGATLLAATPISIFGTKAYEQLPHEQQAFLEEFENWVDEYLPVIEKQNLNPTDLENNHKIMQLAERAGKRSEKLVIYMQNESFRAAYLKISERLSSQIIS